VQGERSLRFRIKGHAVLSTGLRGRCAAATPCAAAKSRLRRSALR